MRHLPSLLVLKLLLIKPARCTFSDWKQFINLVFATWECQLDSFQTSCLTIVLGISRTDHVSRGPYIILPLTMGMLCMFLTSDFFSKPTRITSHSTTRNGHIYTNASTDQIIPGIVTMDISVHLPTFRFIRRQIARLKPKRCLRDYSNFHSEAYLNDVKSADWSGTLNDPTDIHTKASSFVEKHNGIANKHAPIKGIPCNHLRARRCNLWHRQCDQLLLSGD